MSDLFDRAPETVQRVADAIWDADQEGLPKFTHRKRDAMDEATGVAERYRRLARAALIAQAAHGGNGPLIERLTPKSSSTTALSPDPAPDHLKAPVGEWRVVLGEIIGHASDYANNLEEDGADTLSRKVRVAIDKLKAASAPVPPPVDQGGALRVFAQFVANCSNDPGVVAEADAILSALPNSTGGGNSPTGGGDG